MPYAWLNDVPCIPFMNKYLVMKNTKNKEILGQAKEVYSIVFEQVFLIQF